MRLPDLVGVLSRPSSLAVAVLTPESIEPSSTPDGAAPWGGWGLHPLDDAAVLATDATVLDPATTHVLVLAADSHAPAAHVVASTIAAARPDLPVRVLTAPVSLTVLVRALELVPADAGSPNRVHDAVVAALDSLTWAAWLPSVAKLSAPPPSVGQHVRSWFADRKRGFLAVQGDPGWVAQLPVADLAAERRLTRLARGGAPYECHVFGEVPETAVATLFDMGLNARPVRRDPIASPATSWGSAKAVELVLSTPVVLPAPELDRCCPACAEPVAGASCPFCRVAPVRGGSLDPGAPLAPGPVPEVAS
ncbi:hypothetical protein ABFT23_03875 [Nocardioides sp. C4-1]|uniref:hypothetical protein n=1 Tax=Nocardioides sp. C4-1 TaxID=3151851 RepID=UPI003265B9BE